MIEPPAPPPTKPFEERSSDPRFDLRQGLVILVVIVVVVVIITLICVWLARP